MKRIPVDSSMIAWVAYDKKEKLLEVEFINTGNIYQYFDVPAKEYKGLMEASSKGSYMRDCIIDCYDYTKVKKSRYRQETEAEEQTIEDFAGSYRIFEMEDFDKEYMHAEQQAFIKINPDGSGEFGFGYVHGYMRGKVKTRNGETLYKFRWEGNDENDEAHGDGWLLMDDPDEVEGEIAFFDGDEHYFRAKKKNR
jgi:hypothetical protein